MNRETEPSAQRGRISTTQRGQAGERDHRAVVGAQAERREKDRAAMANRIRLQSFTQLGVGTHTASDDKPVESGGLECTSRLDRQHIDNGFDKGASNVSAALLA